MKSGSSKSIQDSDNLTKILRPLFKINLNHKGVNNLVGKENLIKRPLNLFLSETHTVDNSHLSTPVALTPSMNSVEEKSLVVGVSENSPRDEAVLSRDPSPMP